MIIAVDIDQFALVTSINCRTNIYSIRLNNMSFYSFLPNELFNMFQLNSIYMEVNFNYMKMNRIEKNRIKNWRNVKYDCLKDNYNRCYIISR